MINFEKHIDELVHTYCDVTLCKRCIVGRNNCIAYKNRVNDMVNEELCKKVFKEWLTENDYGDNPDGNGVKGFYLTLKQKGGYKLALKADEKKTEIHASEMETGKTASFPVSKTLAKEIAIRLTDRFPELRKELGIKLLEKAGYKAVEHSNKESAIQQHKETIEKTLKGDLSPAMPELSAWEKLTM